MVSAEPKNTGVSRRAVVVEVEGVAGAAHHQFDFLAQGVGPVRAQFLIHGRGVETLDGVTIDAHHRARVVEVDEILVEVIDAPPSSRPMPMGRVIGAQLDLEHILDFVQQFDRFAAVPIQFVDEGEDRGVAQAAHSSA